MLSRSLLTSLLITSAYGYNLPGLISIYQPSKDAKADSVTSQDCSIDKPHVEVKLDLNNCLWGDYYLVNNIKIDQWPECTGSGNVNVNFYATTSCTGKPTFTSTNPGGELEGRCLFGSSPQKWSMIFTCGERNTQAVERYHFKQAVPPPASQYIRPPRAVAAEGVVAPYFSMDCSINIPKEPTFLPADVCYTLPVGHSVYISEPATCKDGKTPLAVTYQDEDCVETNSWLGSDAWSDHYRESIDKKCHTTYAKSMAFKCSGDQMRKFKDLPPHVNKDVEPLLVLDPPKKETPTPTPSPTISSTSTSSATGTPQPPSNSHYPSSGIVLPHRTSECEDKYGFPLSIRGLDTCINSTTWQAVEIKRLAICTNGTMALLARFSNSNCEDGYKNSLKDGKFITVDEDLVDRCIPMEDVQSMIFWCEGIKGKENNGEDEGDAGGNGGKRKGDIKILLIVLAVMIGICMLGIIGYLMRGVNVMYKMRELGERIKALSGRREGEIQL